VVPSHKAAVAIINRRRLGTWNISDSRTEVILCALFPTVVNIDQRCIVHCAKKASSPFELAAIGDREIGNAPTNAGKA